MDIQIPLAMETFATYFNIVFYMIWAVVILVIAYYNITTITTAKLVTSNKNLDADVLAVLNGETNWDNATFAGAQTNGYIIR